MGQEQGMLPDIGFMENVQERSGIAVSSCYQCKKCTNGCPVTFAMDIYPDQIIRLVQLGQKERVLSSATIWVCSSCATCTTRCPNGVDIAGVMDHLKERAIKAGVAIPQERTKILHTVFLDEIRKRGRIFEGGLVQNYLFKSGDFWRKLKSGELLEEVEMGITMLRKGRMPLLPKGIKGKREVRQIMS